MRRKDTKGWPAAEIRDLPVIALRAGTQQPKIKLMNKYEISQVLQTLRTTVHKELHDSEALCAGTLHDVYDHLTKDYEYRCTWFLQTTVML